MRGTKTLKAITAFIGTFLVYHIIGSNFFPVDENNVLQAPNWYPILGISIAAGVTYLYIKGKRKKEESQKKNFWRDSFWPTSFQIKTEESVPPPIVKQEAKKKLAYIPVKNRNPMEVIRLMESRFEEQYKFSYTHLLNSTDCQKMYDQTVKEFSSIELPLVAQVRFEQLCAEYKEKFKITNPFVVIDAMEGHAFEFWCAELLKKNGFINVEVTKGSGDQGVDILAVKDGIRYAIQCKCYSTDLGNKSVQEVHAGKAMYHCQVGVVMTNRHFTPGAKQLAEATGVLLWDRDKLEEMIRTAP